MVGVPPSVSVAVALQVSALEVVTPLDGVTVTVLITGAVLSTVTLSLPESESPLPSVAVAVHVMVSLGAAVPLVRVRLAPEPRVADPLVHA
jgi:hypothetical protein